MSDSAVKHVENNEFQLDASDEELLDEFGLLMAAEYYYSPTKEISTLREGARDALQAVMTFGLSDVALKIPRSTLEKRFEQALAGERRLRG